MRAIEFILEDPGSIREKVLAAVKKDGGNINDYFIRFTNIDQLGFSGKQLFGKSPDVDDPKFSIDYIGANKGRRAIWFYPLAYYLRPNAEPYATESPYVWLIKLKPNAWLQVVKSDKAKIEPAPPGKERVGIIRMSHTPAAIFFRPGYDLVAKFYNYAGQHKRHGNVKGAPEPNILQKIRNKFGQ